jgi:hypothetical protein
MSHIATHSCTGKHGSDSKQQSTIGTLMATPYRGTMRRWAQLRRRATSRQTAPESMSGSSMNTCRTGWYMLGQEQVAVDSWI